MQSQAEEWTQAHSRHRQRSGQLSHTHSHSDEGADKLGSGIDIADAKADGETDPGTQQTQTEERTTHAQPQTPGQAAIASDGKVNKDTRRPKFISFSINNILGHSEKHTNDRTDKQMIELVKKITE